MTLKLGKRWHELGWKNLMKTTALIHAGLCIVGLKCSEWIFRKYILACCCLTKKENEKNAVLFATYLVYRGICHQVSNQADKLALLAIILLLADVSPTYSSVLINLNSNILNVCPALRKPTMHNHISAKRNMQHFRTTLFAAVFSVFCDVNTYRNFDDFTIT